MRFFTLLSRPILNERSASKPLAKRNRCPSCSGKLFKSDLMPPSLLMMTDAHASSGETGVQLARRVSGRPRRWMGALSRVHDRALRPLVVHPGPDILSRATSKRRRRKASSWIPADSSSRQQFPHLRLAGRYRGSCSRPRPRSALWSSWLDCAGSNPAGTAPNRLLNSHRPRERPPGRATLARVAGLRRTPDYGFVRDHPGQ